LNETILVRATARLWSLDHFAEYAKNTAELTKLPEDVLLKAYTAQRTSPIAIDENVIREVQEASDRSTRYGILPRKLDVSKADRPQLHRDRQSELTRRTALATRDPTRIALAPQAGHDDR
jgi:ABC-type nitrate/sulfonate/bicarbonate transport system substrate-binding protein